MTRETKPKLGKGKKVAEAAEKSWGGFVNVPLNEDEKVHFRQWVVENETEIAEEISATQLAGFKFSSTWDADNDCFVATLTGCGIRKVQPTWVCAMSARGDSWFGSLALVIYKHIVICEGDWSNHWSEGKKRFGSEI